ncbi:MAG: hypothetical protein C5B58_02640 [Acidobacteria bacterium]|nr:MAG: hypothetical protein C5B58_02640 [Acidobacteriota bacterium]
MMTKRIENPAAVHGRQNRPWWPVGTSSCSSVLFALTAPPLRIRPNSADEQELVPTGDRERQTDNGEP